MQNNSSPKINTYLSHPIIFPNWKFKNSQSLTHVSNNMTTKYVYAELDKWMLKEAISKEIASFHSYGLHKRKHEKHVNALMIGLYRDYLQLSFDEF